MKRHLEVGDVVETNYGTGPYAILQIIRGCTCPEYLAKLEFGDEAPLSPPHLHLVVRGLTDHHKGKRFYLNGYDEDTLRSVWGDDRLILREDLQHLVGPVQRTLWPA